MGYFNYHTHTNFCDGRNTAEEMVQKAIELGFDTLGFSGHSPAPESEFYAVRDLDAYYDCISRLKDKYSGRIKILCGIERDIWAYPDEHEYDYALGAIHQLKINGRFYIVDLSPAAMKSFIDELYGGDGNAFAVEYMRQVKDVARITGCDIIAHFDLVSKFNGDGENKFFDPCGAEYLEAAQDAIKENIKYCDLFEVNTGAIGRNWRTTPYPTPEMLDMIRAAGGRVTFGSDTHATDTMLCGYEQAQKLIKSHGFADFSRI